MPSVPFARNFNQDYSQSKLRSSSHVPVIVVTGGTSGIGEAVARAFARYTNGRCHLVLVGRSREAADSILSSLPRPDESPESAGWKHEFVACDVSLMSEVQKVTKELATRLPKINYLVLSAGIVTWQARDETPEGLDRRLAVRYYARWVFLNNLISSLRRASDAGEPASVLSVLGSIITRTWPIIDEKGNKQPTSWSSWIISKLFGAPAVPTINTKDLGFKEAPTAMSATAASGLYNDVMIDTFADQNPAIDFAHLYPGVVKTPTMFLGGFPKWYLEVLGKVLTVFLRTVVAKSQDDCAELMLYTLFSGKGGSTSRNEMGDVVRFGRVEGPTADSESDKKALWEHTLKATGSS